MLWHYSFFFILWIAHGLCLKLSGPLTAVVNQDVNITWTKDPKDPFSTLTFCWQQKSLVLSGKVEGCTDTQTTTTSSGVVTAAFLQTGQYFVGAFLPNHSGGNHKRDKHSGGGNGGNNDDGDDSDDESSSSQPLTGLTINVQNPPDPTTTTPAPPPSNVSTVGGTTTSGSSPVLSTGVTSSSTPETSSSLKPDPTAPLIVGIVLTATVLVALLLTFFILRYRRKRRFHGQLPSDIRGSIEKPLWLENMYMNHPESNGPRSVRPITISTAPDLDYTESESRSSDRDTLTFFPYMMVRNTAQPSPLKNPISLDRTVGASASEPSESGRTNGPDKKSETETVVSRSTDTPSILPPGFSYPTIVTTPATPEPVLVYTPRTRTT